MPCLSIIIPAYNESKTIKAILEKVDQVVLDSVAKEILVVDDCSQDVTADMVLQYKAEHPGSSIKLISQTPNQGKGAAIHRGIAEATGEYIIIQDADLEYNPQEYTLLLAPMQNGFADVVYGSRFMGGKPHRILFFWHTIGNKFLTFLSNLLTNLNLTDMETGYKLFRSSVLKNLTLKEKRFGFEPEVTARMAKVPGIRVYEVGISYYGRTYAEGKKIGWKDGVAAIWAIIKYNLFA